MDGGLQLRQLPRSLGALRHDRYSLAQTYKLALTQPLPAYNSLLGSQFSPELSHVSTSPQSFRIGCQYLYLNLGQTRRKEGNLSLSAYS